MIMFLKNFQFKTLILFAIIFAISCDQDKIVHNDSGETIQREQITGFVQKGPFINGTSISMYELNSSMEQTGRAFNTQIHNNQGSFEVNNVELSSPYVELSANGYYYNEINGQVTQSTINLLALSDISDKSTINVNILTHLEKRRVEYLIAQGNSFSEAKKIAQAEVLAIFGIEKSNIASSESLDISIENEDNAILIAISVILQGNRTPGQLTELLANITTNIRDSGILNNHDVHLELRNSAVILDLADIRINLENRYQELDIQASIPEFESYVNKYLSFTAQEPSAITKAATDITDSSATLHATVNPNSSPTSIYFEYGSSTDYGNVVEVKESQLSGLTDVSISATISELSHSAIYHYRVMAENKVGITYGDDMTLMTLSADKPSAITKAATDITDLSARLHGTVNPNYPPTNVYFEYGTTLEFGNIVDAEPSPVSGTDDISVHAYIDDLSENTKYHFNVKAVNKHGITYGEAKTFRTWDSVTDIDGNIYNTQLIGYQEWMLENLKVTRYRNGDAIPIGLGDTEWQNTTSGAYAVYPHSGGWDEVNVDGVNSDEKMLELYGALYNWYAVDDDRGLCPPDWHVPSDDEWTTLINYLGGESIAYGNMKSTRTKPDPHPRWENPNSGANNESGFSGLPGGSRNMNGHYGNIGYGGYFWSSTDSDSSNAWSRYLDFRIESERSPISKQSGFSVRCIRD
jgi:uncharacterized protein (TIGR02145 family)